MYLGCTIKRDLSPQGKYNDGLAWLVHALSATLGKVWGFVAVPLSLKSGLFQSLVGSVLFYNHGFSTSYSNSVNQSSSYLGTYSFQIDRPWCRSAKRLESHARSHVMVSLSRFLLPYAILREVVLGNTPEDIRNTYPSHLRPRLRDGVTVCSIVSFV